MIVQVSTPTYIASELLLDAGFSPVTTKINTDWTKTATLLGTATTATPTITHRANGYYDVLVTFPTVGVWSVEYSVMVDGETVRFDPVTVQVLTAAQFDPASALPSAGEIVSALGDPFTQPASGYEAGTLGAKVARIGTTGAGVTNPSTTTATTMTIRRGDDYTLGSPRGPFEWTEDTWESYGLTDDGVVITWALTGTTTTKAMSAVDSTTVRLELTDTETALLPYGIIPFTVKAAIGADTITLIAGTATIT